MDVASTTERVLLVTEPSGPGRGVLPRVNVKGKFFFAGDEKFYLKGITYGTFALDAMGKEIYQPGQIERDFREMASHGFNTVRTYTVPPLRLLDAAMDAGLRVMVGIPWEQHVTFLDTKKSAISIQQGVREAVFACRDHPAIFCYAIGNEIPGPIVRWHGARAVENFLKTLFFTAKEVAADTPVTYVNYPTTEYLDLGFLDFLSFNVYLETQRELVSYLQRLQNIAGERPLVLAEIGLDSKRHGLEKQGGTLAWQIRATFAEGCAGAIVFGWTDEWYRGGHRIIDWEFGITDAARGLKPALEWVRKAFGEVPFPPGRQLPRISVVVCTCNGARTLRECLENLMEVEYSDYEVIVVDDGSTDGSAAITAEFPVRLISTRNQGLSSARNTGWKAATGEIVAYLDDDAYPDKHWLLYLASTFQTTSHVAVGGPNIGPPGDGLVAECVLNAPGGPVHVLLTDTVAEHIPGCNMAVRKSALEAINGFDPEFRVAGDDVDLCWRLQERGWTIGFNPGALVWHHRRNSIRTYWRQQKGYGKAEAFLERKWPEKYNAVGHIRWAGQLYGKGLTRMLGGTSHIYHGVWGRAPFQSLHKSPPSLLSVLPTMPEWYLVIMGLLVLCGLAVFWPKLLLALPFLGIATGATILQAALSAGEASFPSNPSSWIQRIKLRTTTWFLHVAQPLARLTGRVGHGLTAWRLRVPFGLARPFPQKAEVWSEVWRSPEACLYYLESHLKQDAAIVLHGGDYDKWDLEVRGGLLGSARLLMAVEEHGAGKQLFRFRLWPRFWTEGWLTILILGILSTSAWVEEVYIAALLLSSLTVVLGVRALHESACAMAAFKRVLKRGFIDEE